MGNSGGIVLVGGRSSRMGSPKASLEWHGSTLARRIAGIVARVVDGPVVVVRAPGQSLPALAPDVEVVEDSEEGRGPLAGLAAGLAALEGRAEVAYLSSVDVPFLHPAFVGRVIDGMGGFDVCLPRARGFSQPLAAAYRTSLRPLVEGLVSGGRLRPAILFDECRVRRLDEEELLADPRLARADPGLDSVLNLNSPADYAESRARPAPEVVIVCAGSLWRAESARPVSSAAGSAASRRIVARAATLGAAAEAVDVQLGGGRVPVAINGLRSSSDPETPLVLGDLVTFGLDSD